MAEPAKTPLPPATSTTAELATAAIVSLVGRGMTAKEILRLFPEFTRADIRAALLRAAEVVQDENASLSSVDRIGAMIADAQRHSGLTEDEAMALAVEETRAARAERARR